MKLFEFLKTRVDEEVNMKRASLVLRIQGIISNSIGSFFPGAGLSNFERFYDNREVYADAIAKAFLDAVEQYKKESEEE